MPIYLSTDIKCSCGLSIDVGSHKNIVRLQQTEYLYSKQYAVKCTKIINVEFIVINVRLETSCDCRQGYVSWKWECYPQVVLGKYSTEK